jgi:hypothetical protein
METSLTLSHELAKDFNKEALEQLATHARLCADIMLKHGPVPWKMDQGERDALDTFRQFAAYSRRIIDML